MKAHLTSGWMWHMFTGIRMQGNWLGKCWKTEHVNFSKAYSSAEVLWYLRGSNYRETYALDHKDFSRSKWGYLNKNEGENRLGIRNLNSNLSLAVWCFAICGGVVAAKFPVSCYPVPIGRSTNHAVEMSFAHSLLLTFVQHIFLFSEREWFCSICQRQYS